VSPVRLYLLYFEGNEEEEDSLATAGWGGSTRKRDVKYQTEKGKKGRMMVRGNKKFLGVVFAGGVVR